MEVYYEKNVVNDSIDRHKKRNIVLNVLRILSIALIIFAVFLVLYFQGIPIGQGGLAITLSIIGSVLMIGFPVLMLLAVNRIIGRLNAEFDYYILYDTFRVVRVINRKKRKRLIEFPMSAVASIGLVDGDSFDRYDADRTVKKIHAFCNDDAELGYFYLSNDGERKLLILEVDVELLASLKRCVLMSVFDDSIRKALISAEKATRPDNAAKEAVQTTKTVGFEKESTSVSETDGAADENKKDSESAEK